jgi:hypothetical protein
MTVKDFKLQAKSYGVSTDTFTVKSYTDKTRMHAIDQISSGLTIYSCEDGTYPNKVE